MAKAIQMKKIIWPEGSILEELYIKNRSCLKVAKELGVSTTSVYLKLKRIGVRVMTASEAGKLIGPLQAGAKHSAETKEKMSRIVLAHYANGRLGPMTGKHHSLKTRLRISKIQIGRKLAQETKEKLSAATMWKR